jgi:glyoxylase-like metal-dependent hydrolase (beta-lactamase superfamily II)
VVLKWLVFSLDVNSNSRYYQRMLKVEHFTLGPVETNSFLLINNDTNESVMIDPAGEGNKIREYLKKSKLNLCEIWLTHAHFDHIAGIPDLIQGMIPQPPIYLHQGDEWLFQNSGGAGWFGIQLETGDIQTTSVAQGDVLRIGKYDFEVLFAPGHTPGHVMYFCRKEELLFAGDVIFRQGIGRTDLPGGDHMMLISSIQTQVFTLPDSTRILCGHGPETGVGIERRTNPFF